MCLQFSYFSQLIYLLLLTCAHRYRKGFELQPTLYSGINLAVLLIVAGQQFENSMELRKIGDHPLLAKHDFTHSRQVRAGSGISLALRSN